MLPNQAMKKNDTSIPTLAGTFGKPDDTGTANESHVKFQAAIEGINKYKKALLDLAK